MTNLIPLINSCLTPEMQGILYFLSLQAQKYSGQIYCAGSFVRDLLLGREGRRLELIITGSAIDFARQLTAILPGKLLIYEKFGTATLISLKGFVLEMTTARTEFNPFAAAAEASYEESSLKKALFERDFTIDTLACSLSKESFGKLYDFFGGLTDLKNKSLKVLYRLSLVERPLRMLRLLRLEQRFGFSLGEETEILLQQAIANNVIGRVSKESLSGEVRLLFAEPSPVKILLRLADLGLFSFVFPRVKLTPGLIDRLQSLEGFLPQMEKEKREGQNNVFLAHLNLLFSELTEHDLHYMCHCMRLKRKERQEILQNHGTEKFFRSEII